MERSLNDARIRRLSHKWQPELRAVFCDWWIIIVCQQDAWANLCTFGWFLKILVPQTSIHSPPPLNLGDSVLVGDYGCIITQLLATTVEENWGPFWHRPLEAELGPTVGSTRINSPFCRGSGTCPDVMKETSRNTMWLRQRKGLDPFSKPWLVGSWVCFEVNYWRDPRSGWRRRADFFFANFGFLVGRREKDGHEDWVDQ